MDPDSRSMRPLVERLIAFDRAQDPTCDVSVGVRVCEKLRASITLFAGAEGFSALLRRSIALARTDVPSLKTVEVGADGSILGLEHMGDKEASEVIVHLLSLLTTFIGEPLTIRLVREAWPDAPNGLG